MRHGLARIMHRCQSVIFRLTLPSERSANVDVYALLGSQARRINDPVSPAKRTVLVRPSHSLYDHPFLALAHIPLRHIVNRRTWITIYEATVASISIHGSMPNDPRYVLKSPHRRGRIRNPDLEPPVPYGISSIPTSHHPGDGTDCRDAESMQACMRARRSLGIYACSQGVICRLRTANKLRLQLSFCSPLNQPCFYTLLILRDLLLEFMNKSKVHQHLQTCHVVAFRSPNT
jgi:hypothetical protein